jgi:2-amino-4-hydroxy-6-hydroxymethyldihydropteridine diphosphokinase
MRAGIALGSNLGDRLVNLQKARDQITALAGVVPPVLQSAIYETKPIKCEPRANNFYNAVIEIGFTKSVEALLACLQKIEISLGRPAKHQANLSRAMDLDLLYFGSQVRHEKDLQLPHPRMTGRAFVLRPLADIAPDLRLPEQSTSIRQLLDAVAGQEIVKCVTNKW